MWLSGTFDSNSSKKLVVDSIPILIPLKQMLVQVILGWFLLENPLKLEELLIPIPIPIPILESELSHHWFIVQLLGEFLCYTL